MADNFADYKKGLDSPASDAFIITPNDGSDLPSVTRAIYVGGTVNPCNISVVTADGTTITIVGALTGSVIPIRVKRVRATGTNATNLLGFI